MIRKASNKKIRICAVFLLSLFVALNVAWGIHHILVFGKYEKITKDESVPNANVSARDNLTFSVSKTKYLNFGGNLGIVATEDEKYLIIWPTLFKGNSFGFMTSDENQTYNFVIDEFGNLLNSDDFTESAQAVYADNKEYAQYLLSEFNAWSKAAENSDFSFFD